MTKRQIYRIIEWSVAIAACGYLIWRLATYEDYASLTASLRAMGWKEWGALVLCVALMPVNMAIEAWRWCSLMNERVKELKNERLTFREAQRQVYYSKLAGLITPWRLGEYPARGVLMNEKPTSDKVLRTTIGSPIEQSSSPVKGRDSSVWPQVLSMGVVGSATMTFAIVLAGVVAMGCWLWVTGYGLPVTGYGLPVTERYLIILAVIILFLGVGLYFAPRLLKRWAKVSHRLVAVSLGQSLVRLICWCVQLTLVLYALGAVTGYGLWVTGARCFVYYLLVTITPNVPIAEVGVRGAWAMIVFGTANAALAGVILWGINTLLPCLIWPFIRKEKNKINLFINKFTITCLSKS